MLGACLNGLVEMRMGGRMALEQILGRKWGEERVFEGGGGGVDGGECETLIPMMTWTRTRDGDTSTIRSINTNTKSCCTTHARSQVAITYDGDEGLHGGLLLRVSDGD